MRKTGITTGFTLIEVLISTAVFLVVVSGIYGAYRALYASMSGSSVKLAASSLLAERFEELRNAMYEDVAGGVAVEERDGRSFTVTTEVEEGDYKLVEVRVECAECRNFEPLRAVGVFVDHDEE